MHTAASRRAAGVVAVVGGLLLFTPPVVNAETTGAAPTFENYCTPDFPGIEELSGMIVIDGTIYGMGDSGSDFEVFAFDESCHLQRKLKVPVEPYDVEDLTAHDGALWLSDTGDNRHQRKTVALTRMNTSDGAGELHRLTYPDGPHDAETLLIEPSGRPVIVTKEWSGTSSIFTPADGKSVSELPTPGPSALTKQGEITLAEPGDSGFGQLITGGAVSADGSVAALRTYSKVFLFPVSDGDVVAALKAAPALTVPITDPQGESLAFLPNGDLLAGSEAGFGSDPKTPPIQILHGATDLVRPAQAGSSGSVQWWALAAAAAVMMGLSLWRIRSARRKR